MFVLSKYKKILSKYSTPVYFQSTKCYFQSTQVHFQNTRVYFHSTKIYFREVQSNSRNLGNAISGTRNLLNTLGSRNPVPRTGPSKPREQNLTPRNPSNTETFETSGSLLQEHNPYGLGHPALICHLYNSLGRSAPASKNHFSCDQPRANAKEKKALQ